MFKLCLDAGSKTWFSPAMQACEPAPIQVNWFRTGKREQKQRHKNIRMIQ